MFRSTYSKSHVQSKIASLKKAIAQGGGKYPLTKMSVNIQTANDERVCNQCKQARKAGHPLPPDHPNCRCRVTRG